MNQKEKAATDQAQKYGFPAGSDELLTACCTG